METYILILTLAISGGNGTSGIGGLGGVAIGEFSSRASCESAASTWLEKVDQIKPLNTGLSKDGINDVKIAFCSPK